MQPLRLILLAVLLAVPSLLYGQVDESPAQPEFDMRRSHPRPLHPSETERFREVGLRDWGVAFNFYYTTRSYNISDTRRLKNSLATTWLNSFEIGGLGARVHVEHRLSPEWRMSFLPRADIAYGILNSSYHNEFEFEDLPFKRNLPSANDSQKLSLNLEFEFAMRWRWLWFTAKANSWMVFRKREIRGYTPSFRDPQLGVISDVSNRKRTEWEQAYLFGGATGVGFEFFFLDPQVRFILFTLVRPYNYVQFRGGSGITHGMEIMVRSADFDISNVVGIFFEASFQAYLPTSDFSNIYYSQFAVGIRFR
jgi:hypothetical protein